MRRWLYPGSFDPFTLGHVNITRRAAQLCDELIIAVLPNEHKPGAFSPKDRVKIIEASLEYEGLQNVRAVTYYGLLVNLMHEANCEVVVRGLRSESDFRYEAEMMTANSLLYDDYEAVYFITDPEMGFISSSVVREVAAYGGNIDDMVSPAVAEFVAQALHNDQSPRVK